MEEMITACEFTKTGFRRSDTANRVSRVTGVFPTVAEPWTYNCPNDTVALSRRLPKASVINLVAIQVNLIHRARRRL
jgi:hypothetical protein